MATTAKIDLGLSRFSVPLESSTVGKIGGYWESLGVIRCSRSSDRLPSYRMNYHISPPYVARADRNASLRGGL
jgi:hypothetical protein